MRLVKRSAILSHGHKTKSRSHGGKETRKRYSENQGTGNRGGEKHEKKTTRLMTAGIVVGRGVSSNRNHAAARLYTVDGISKKYSVKTPRSKKTIPTMAIS